MSGILALVVGAGFVLVDLAYNQGSFVAPLDDAYIHLQYGSQIGRGQWFQYNSGDPVSTGASSMLYSLALGAAYAVGFQGKWLLPFAVVFGVLCFTVTVVCVGRLCRKLVNTQAGAWTSLLVAVSGPLLWGATSGMEVSLVAMLLVGSALTYTWDAPKEYFVATPVVASLLALTRPEGLIFAAVLCAAMLYAVGRAAFRRRCGLGQVLIRGVWITLPLIVGVCQLLFYFLSSGTPVANGIQSKSHLYNQPIIYGVEVVDRTVATFREIVDTFIGLDDFDYLFPGALFVGMVGVAHLVCKQSVLRPLVVAIAIGTLLVLIAVSTLHSAFWHYLRYSQPLIPLLILFAVAGVYGISSAVTNLRTQRVGRAVVMVIALLFSVTTLPTWALRLGRDAAVIRDTDVSVGAWISGNLPPDAKVAVKDVGAAKYFGGRYVIDLNGLTTNGLAIPANHGIGALYEALLKLPVEKRPEYFAVYESPAFRGQALGSSMVDLLDTGVLKKKPLITFAVTAPENPVDGRIVPFEELSIYQADWSLARTGEVLQTASGVQDYLNVADLESERSHSYSVLSQQVGAQPRTMLRRVSLPDGRWLVDSGRHVIGGETFTVRNLTPGKPLTITSRSSSPKGTPAEVRAVVNGVAATVWQRSSTTEGWNESTLSLPGHLVTGQTVEVSLVPVRPLLSPYPDYASYGYWFTQ